MGKDRCSPMLGYTKEDIHYMCNSIHDAKLYYLKGESLQQSDEPELVNGLLKAQDFLQGLFVEGYFDEP
jgi:hypothetical protein